MRRNDANTDKHNQHSSREGERERATHRAKAAFTKRLLDVVIGDVGLCLLLRRLLTTLAVDRIRLRRTARRRRRRATVRRRRRRRHLEADRRNQRYVLALVRQRWFHFRIRRSSSRTSSRRRCSRSARRRRRHCSRQKELKYTKGCVKK